MARRPATDSHDSRERILAIATELFAQRGYAGTGVDLVSERAKIAKTAIYYHFGNKEGLLASVLERAATTWIEAIREASRRAGSAPAERLDRALAGMRTLLEEKPWILKLLQILALEVADDKPEIRQTLQSIVHRAKDAITGGMREALGFDLPDADTVAALVLAVLDGISLGVQLDPDMVDLDKAFGELRKLVLFMVAVRVSPDILSRFEAGLAASVVTERASQH